MALEQRVYTTDQLHDIDLKNAPALDLPELITDYCMVPNDSGKYMLFLAHVDPDYRPESGCPYCGKDVKLTRSGRSKPRLVHDVMRNNYRVDIAIMAPRLQCEHCKNRFVPNIPGIVDRRQMTERLYEFLQSEIFIQPLSTLAQRTGFSVDYLGDILDAEIDRMESEHLVGERTAPRVLGIDEKHIQHEMRGTLVDVESGRLLDMLPDNAEKTMTDAIKRLEGWDTNIEVITTDMANQYIKWLSALLPNTTIVVDKYHVIQDVERKISTARKALYQYRKSLIAEIDDPVEKARQSGILRIVNNNKRLFNYSMARLQREQTRPKKRGKDKGKDPRRLEKLSTVIDEFPEFRLLHNLHYTVEYMYTVKTRAEAEAIWNEWEELLPPVEKKSYAKWCDLYSVDQNCFDAWRSLSRAGFMKFKPYILNYFNSSETRVTNAATEGLNSLIGSINISGNGYSFKRLRGKCLYASLIHQRICYGVELQSIPTWKPNVMKFHNYESTDWAKMGGDATFSGVVEEQRISFTQYTEEIALPAPNIYGDNSWLFSVLSADFVEEADAEYRMMLARISEQKGQYKAPEHPDSFTVDEEDIVEHADKTYEMIEHLAPNHLTDADGQ